MESTVVLRQQRADLVREMGTLLVRGDKNSLEKRSQLDHEQKAMLARIESIEAANESERVMSLGGNRVPETLGTFTPGDEITQQRSTQEYRRQFETFIRTGERGDLLLQTAGPHGGISKTSKRALGAGSGADGATLVPQGFERELETKMKAIGGFFQNCRVLKTETGNPLPWPTMDDTSNVGEFLAEGTPGTSDDDMTFSNVVLGSNLLSSKSVLVSVQLEQDAFTDIVAVLRDAFAIRLARALEPQLVTGTGSPIIGLLTALQSANYTGGPTGSYIALAAGANANSGNDADTDLNSIGTQDLSNTIKALDPLYRPDAKWAGNMETFDKLRSQLDRYGRPLWSASLIAGDPDKIWGYPFFWSQSMPTIGAGNISLVFGDFSKYIIRQSLGIQFVRFMELFMTSYQRGYQAFMRIDAKLLQSAAFSVLQHPDS